MFSNVHHCLYKVAYALATSNDFYTVLWVHFEVAWLCGFSDLRRHCGHLNFFLIKSNSQKSDGAKSGE